MKLTIIHTPADNYYHDLEEHLAEQNLVYYASEVFRTMEFESTEELQEALKRAMEVCRVSGLPMKNNFKRIYKCSPSGEILFDWKLSVLAYHLVGINGDAGNPRVATLQINLLKEIHQ